MFKNLFPRGGVRSESGLFKVVDQDLVPVAKIKGNGSINNCIETIGFPTNHIHIVQTFESKKITCLGFKVLTHNLEFVLAKESKSHVSMKDVLETSKKIDWDFEYGSSTVEDILQEGIDLENFSFDFVESILDLDQEESKLFKNEKYGYYLHFDNSILKAFSSSDWDTTSTKWLRKLNPTMVNDMLAEATKFQKNDIEAREEVNRQTKALMNTPDAMQNEFLHLHQKENFNFYNLLVTHYNKSCDRNEFLFMNKGRYKQLDDFFFEVGNYKYMFAEDDTLKGVYEL